MWRGFPCLVFFLILVLSGVRVWAQTAVELDRIVIEAPVHDSTDVSGQESIPVAPQNLPRRAVSEMLSRVAGVHILRTGMPEQASGISLRGSASSQVNVFLDDVPLGSASSEGITLNFLRAQDFAHVKIYKSFAPAEFGAQAIGGVVQLTPQKIKPGHGAEVSIGAGSYGTADASVGWRYGARQHELALGFDYHRTSGDFTFLDNNGTPLNSADDLKTRRRNNAQQSLHPHLLWQYHFDDHLTLKLAQHFFRVDHGVPGLENFQSQTANRSLTEWLGQVSLIKKSEGSSDPRWKNTLYHRFIKSQFSDLAGEIGLGAGQDNDNTTAIFGDRFFVNYNLGRHVSLKPQVEYGFERFVPRDYLAASPVGSASKRQTIGFSLEPHFEFFAKRFEADLLLWSGHVFYNINNNDPSLVGAGTFFSSKVEHPLTAMVSLRYRLWRDLFLKGSAGRSMRLPLFSELFGDQGFVLGNTQLTSESSLKFDLGISWQKKFSGWFDQMHLELTYFENHVQDLIQFELANGLARASNLGRARIRGVEAVLGFKFFDVFEVSPNYTWQEPRDLVSLVGGNLVGRARHEANLALDFRKKFLSVGSNLNYVDGQALDRLNTQVIRHRWRWDLNASAQLGKKFSLGLEAQNILGTQIVDAVGFPLPGRSFMGTVGARF